MERPPVAVSREKLYEEVWAEPMTTVALRYEVSSTFLARVCERLNVPRPPRGYWQQLKVGKASAKPPLPAAEPGDEVEWVRDGSAPLPRPRPATTSTAPRPKPALAERPARHPLVVGAREHFESGRVSTYDDDKYLRPYKRNIVDIVVSKDTLKRALEMASDLFLALEDRGHRVAFAPGGARYTRTDLHHRDGEKRENEHCGRGQERGRS
jgi:hypothetical protein